MVVLLLSLTQIILITGDPPTPKVEKAPTTEYVRLLANSGEMLCFAVLMEYGAAAFPAYETILTDPKSEIGEIAGVLSALNFVKAPIVQFRRLVVPYLSHKDRIIREPAVGLMKIIGTPGEGSILIALLSDEDKSIAHQAATALAKVGGVRDVIAMDAWLRAGVAHRGEPNYLIHVKKCRDELENRWKENPVPKGLRDSPAP